MGLVQQILGQIDDDFARRVAAHSVPAVMSAQPIDLLPNEEPKRNRNVPGADVWIHHSPNQRYLDYVSPDDGEDVLNSSVSTVHQLASQLDRINVGRSKKEDQDSVGGI